MSLREQLARKRARETSLVFPIGGDGQRLAGELAEAESQLRAARILTTGDSDHVKAITTRVEELRAQYEPHSVTIAFRGMTETERDALASEYAGPEGEDPDVVGWTAAALEVSALDSDLTAQEWRDELASDRWTAGDVEAIRDAIQAAYREKPAAGIPKG